MLKKESPETKSSAPRYKVGQVIERDGKNYKVVKRKDGGLGLKPQVQQEPTLAGPEFLAAPTGEVQLARESLDGIDAKIKSNDAVVSRINSQLETAAYSSTEIGESIQAVQAEIDQLTAKIESLKGERTAVENWRQELVATLEVKQQEAIELARQRPLAEKHLKRLADEAKAKAEREAAERRRLEEALRAGTTTRVEKTKKPGRIKKIAVVAIAASAALAVGVVGYNHFTGDNDQVVASDGSEASNMVAALEKGELGGEPIGACDMTEASTGSFVAGDKLEGSVPISFYSAAGKELDLGGYNTKLAMNGDESPIESVKGLCASDEALAADGSQVTVDLDNVAMTVASVKPGKDESSIFTLDPLDDKEVIKDLTGTIESMETISVEDQQAGAEGITEADKELLLESFSPEARKAYGAAAIDAIVKKAAMDELASIPEGSIIDDEGKFEAQVAAWAKEQGIEKPEIVFKGQLDDVAVLKLSEYTHEGVKLGLDQVTAAEVVEE